jgi:nitroreductase
LETRDGRFFSLDSGFLNQVWAKAAPVLALDIAKLQFSHNDQLHRAAIHDLGLASGYLVLEATARGLSAHQMIGILPDKARELYEIPDGYEPMTGLAIGYAEDPHALPEELAKRDLARRPRKPLREFIFGGKWGSASELVS